MCIDEGDQSLHGKPAKQFTRDDVACMSVRTVNAVLEKLSIKQSVAGIAVLPMKQDVWMVDLVMQDNVEQDTWATQLTLPLFKEDVDA